ncbi:MAG: hypothetical protein ACK476_17570 [Fluviicola sp.]
MKKQHLILALLIHIIAAWFSVGRFHPDEQFQIIEFLGYKTGVNSAQDLPWEFHSEMRSTTQVAFAYGITELFSFITNPFTQVFLLRLISSLLALYALHRLIKYFKNELSERNYTLLSLLGAIYCFIPYFHARFSSENLSISLLILGLVLYLESKKIRNYILVGVLLGLAYTVRMQSLFILFGFGLWVLFVKKEQLKGILLLLSGFSLSVLIGLLSDRWFYGHWVNTTWNYVYENIILHKSESFGTQPFWYYFEKTFLDAIPPMSIVIIVSILFFFLFKVKHILTWMFIPFLLVHFFTAHKELRFLFPLINFIPLFVVLSWQEIENNSRFEKLKNHLIRFKFYLIKPFFWIGNSILLIVLCFKPADNYTPTISFIHNNYTSYKTQVFYTDNNPYDKNNCLNFFKPRDLSVQQISIDTLTYIDLNKYSHSLVVASKDEIRKIKMRGFEVKKVYSTIPDFLYSINFNDWISRTTKTEIYELSINPYIR